MLVEIGYDHDNGEPGYVTSKYNTASFGSIIIMFDWKWRCYV